MINKTSSLIEKSVFLFKCHADAMLSEALRDRHEPRRSREEEILVSYPLCRINR